MSYCKTQNISGVTASVKLIREIATTWRDMNRFEIMNVCKSLVFCFVRQMALFSDTAEIKQADSGEPKGTRDQSSRDLFFAQEQLDETFKVVSDWMDQNHRLPKDVSFLGKELQVPHSISCTRTVFISNRWFDHSCGIQFFSVTRYLTFCSRHGVVYCNRN